ncbi:hypothetical protein BT67DRAFT_443561 [Trichocladium antarcticum]|uniref:Uncharacterized protein n=1 Tax=Trichocladium antarcticum TaxID=1450529 RepID=A0AAN6UH39_9PEZI|nr:hypothetical protein BT67DRAFT_443561 [Trichocladium antarcticum]
MDERYQRSDYGLDEMPGHGKPRPDVSPSGYGRRSRDPLQVGTEPKYPGAGGQLNGYLDPFGVDDAPSRKTDSAPAYSPSVDPQWPKRESSQKKQSTPPIAPI